MSSPRRVLFAALTMGVLLGPVLASASGQAHTAARSASVLDRDGSVLHYRVQFGEQAPDGSYRSETFLDVIFFHVRGDWLVACQGATLTQVEGQPDAWMRVRSLDALDPPVAPTPVAVGDEAAFDVVQRCEERTLTATVVEEAPYPGRPRAIPSYHAHAVAECRCQETTADWSSTTGLLLKWEFLAQNSHLNGRLVWANVRLGS